MTLTESILCGFLQGITEFLPVSSSGHLALAHAFFGFADAAPSRLTFDVFLHLATLLAVCIAYFRDILSLIPAFFSCARKVLQGKRRRGDFTDEEHLALLLILATVPLALAAFFGDRVEALGSRPKVVGGILMGNGILLLLGEKTAKGDRATASLPLPAALGIGFCQLLAVLPGLSRSGLTVTGGRLFGLARKEAVRFSFLLSVPAVLGATLLEVKETLGHPIPVGQTPLILAGMITAALCGFACICLLRRMAEKSNFTVFAIYCMAVGLCAVIFG